MRLRIGIALTITLITAVVSSALVWQSAKTAAVSASVNPKNIQVARKAIQADPPGTINGASNPDAIPD